MPMATCATHAKNHDVSITSANESLLHDVEATPHALRHREQRGHPFREPAPVAIRPGFDVATGSRLSGRFDRLTCRSPRRADRMGSACVLPHSTDRRRARRSARTRATCSGSYGSRAIESVGVEPIYDIEVRGTTTSSPTDSWCTTPKSCTTRTATISRRRGCSSPTWTRRCASTRRSCSSTSAR